MLNSYELATRGIYPYSVSGMPFVPLGSMYHSGEHVHATDLIVDDSQYLVRIDLAGYNKEDISVKTAQGKLIIAAKGGHEISRDLKVIEREIPFGDFNRVYELSNIDAMAVSASFENGILTLTLPRVGSDTEEGERDISFQ